MKKKILSSLIIICLLAAIMPTMALAESIYYNKVLDHNLQMRQAWQNGEGSEACLANYAYSNDEEFKTLSDQIVAGARGDYEKVQAIHDWVCENVYYDNEAGKIGFGFHVVHSDEERKQWEEMSSVEKLLTYKRGVCSYYSSIFSELVRAQGIPCVIVDGFAENGVNTSSEYLIDQTAKTIYPSGDLWTSETYDTSHVNHAWNEVYVGGRWIIVDTTWDSSNRYTVNGKYITGSVQQTYFDISDELFARNHKILKYKEVKIEKHNVVVQPELHDGTVELSQKQAIVGEKVTITVMPDEGYQLERLQVINARNADFNTIDGVQRVTVNEYCYNEDIPLIPVPNTNNQFVFKMPDSSSALIIAADFIPTKDNGAGYYDEAVNWAVAQHIAGVASAVSFAENADCNRAEAVLYLWLAAEHPSVNNKIKRFTDISFNSRYYDAVCWAIEQHITGGISEDTFSPYAAITRGQAMTFLYRFAGSPAVNSEYNFIDVPKDAYYADAIQWAVEQGITSGTSATTFNPNDSCTCGQFITFLYRMR